MEYGFNPSIVVGKRIKVSPTVHYTSGGIEVNTKGMAVGVDNLYVVGEAQFNGPAALVGCQGRHLHQVLFSAKLSLSFILNYTCSHWCDGMLHCLMRLVSQRPLRIW